MRTYPNPAAFTRSVFPERALLLGLLLSAHDLVSRRGGVRGLEWQRFADLVDSAIPLLDPVHVIPHISYGMPAWLVTLILDDLTSGKQESLGTVLPCDLVDAMLHIIARLDAEQAAPPIDNLLELYE